MSEERLEGRVLRSGYWMFTLRFVHQVLYIARLVILARILATHDFGLMGFRV